jgi:hypothetical protein
MKKSLILKTLLGLAVLAVSVSFADAQTPITPPANIGDLTLGFYASSGQGAAVSTLVDLGPIANFINATGTISLTGSTGLAIADLVQTYGSATDPSLNWGYIAGNGTTVIPGVTNAQQPNDNVWFSQPETTPGTLAPEDLGKTKNTLAGASLAATGFNISAQGGNGSFPGGPSGQSTVTIQIPNSSSASYYFADTSNGTNFVQFDGRLPLIDNNIANANANGDVFSDLQYQIPPVSGGPLTLGGPAVTLGIFDFNPSKGTLTYTPVPEPSSLGLTGVGFLSLIGFVALRRRHSAVA